MSKALYTSFQYFRLSFLSTTPSLGSLAVLFVLLKLFSSAESLLNNNPTPSKNIHWNKTPTKSILFTQPSRSATVEQDGMQTILEYIATSDANPVSVQLRAVDANGKIPTWLSVNRKTLNGLAYTTGSEISFDINTMNLTVGKYTAKVTASGAGYKPAVLDILLTVTAGSAETSVRKK